MSEIVLEKVTKAFGRVKVVDNVSFRAEAGKFVVLLGVSMMFQSYALSPHLTVAENIVFGLKVRRLDPRKRNERLKSVAELVGLKEQLDRKPSQLSC